MRRTERLYKTSAIVHSNERLFLRDFVGCVAGTSGGRLAQWLQPGSRVDPSKCQVLYSREDMKCGWPAIITILTRDQYSDLVHVANMKVEVKAMPIDQKDLNECIAGRKLRRMSQPDSLTFGGFPPPPLHHPYEPTIRDKMCFHAITIMKAYQNYSFEELRYMSPPVKRSSENMLVRPNGDGSYSATWTPASVGCYSIVVTIDGYEMEEIFKVEVKEPPQGMTPPSQHTMKKSAHQPNRLRRFIAKHSAGLRIRAHPSLQSEQIGVVPVNGTIAFTDEVHNDDGVWLRLSLDTIKQYCSTAAIEAWCLQYNQHLGKTLLLPVEESKTLLDQVVADTVMRKSPDALHDRRRAPTGFGGSYQVIKCGASGHNVRSKPCLKAPPVGMLVLGNRIDVSEYVVNSDGCWVLLDQATKEKYCFNTDGDAWSLAMNHSNVMYLATLEEPIRQHEKRGFCFGQPEAGFTFGGGGGGGEGHGESGASGNPFVFGDAGGKGEAPKVPKREKKPSVLPKWLKGEDKRSDSESKECLKNSESGSNGNGLTPPGTPKRSISPRTNVLPKVPSRTSSPIALPTGQANFLLDSTSSSPLMSLDITSTDIGNERRSSNQSDTSAFVSSLTRDNSPSLLRENSPTPSSSSLQMKSEASSCNSPHKKESTSESPKLTQKSTQTSPENAENVSIKGQFSIGCGSKEISPKLARKERCLGKSRQKRPVSPVHLHQLPIVGKINYTGEPVKQAMSPLLAESLRAVFAAFLWHEGIVHDAMACASFLKFHPTLPKQGVPVMTRHNPSDSSSSPGHKRFQELTREEKARQRHSVEVSTAGAYLHIKPSVLETLTRSAANANANRNKGGRKVAAGEIKEEQPGEAASGYGYQTVSVLPPALKSLVFLWEELTQTCVQAMAQQPVAESPGQQKRRGLKSDEKEKNNSLDKKNRKGKGRKQLGPKKYSEDSGQTRLGNLAHTGTVESYCELCGDSFPHPVTYHMRQTHSGCGQHAGGKGYNSGGSYCLGWAGNCGDGGVPGSSWYLLCDNCREKYMKNNRGVKLLSGRSRSKKVPTAFVKNLVSPCNSIGLDPHYVMKNNAMFLLELASAADNGISQRRRSSTCTMPSVSENNSPPDFGGPFAPIPPFQCLQALGVNAYHDEPIFYSEEACRQNNHEFSSTGPPSTSGQRPLSEVSFSDNDTDAAKGTKGFHRSVSMGTNGVPWSKAGCDGRVIMMRKRNNSGSEMNEGGSSLLCNPSPALQRLVPKFEGSHSNDHLDEMSILQRPVMQFIFQQHDLEALQLAMKQALRKAMCRVYAMQALNWLLRSVTQPVCLHDLLWWFVTSLTPAEPDEIDEGEKPHRKNEDQDLYVCEHPLSDITIAGDAVHPLPSTFHALLQTIADLMIMLPMGSALQQMAVRCWGIRFTSSDHAFLHRSQVFSNISKILSRSEEMEEFTISMHDSNQSGPNQVSSTVEALKDLTNSLEIKASSRQAMVGSLTDGSTETFWESGDEDRNKTKSLTIICAHGQHPTLICVHIDNCRDLGNKVSSITFFSGSNSEELTKLRTIEVESRLLGGWVVCPISTENNDNVIRLELKGPDNSVRVRHIRLLGHIDGEPSKVGKHYSAATIQRRNCEAETLRVFRLITAQVFGKLIQGEHEGNPVTDSGSVSAAESVDPTEDSNYLREHMVGILFSRSKLTHLQKQVIVHIVQAIRKETARVRDDWEVMLSSGVVSSHSGISQDANKNSDTYCFEMLSMVLALSGSSVGRAYLSHQSGLLGDLVSLLHTGSARVQRQVTSLLRRILPEINPESFAKIMNVTQLPAKDFSIVSLANRSSSGDFDVNNPGILDVFLALIAKSLSVQVKIKTKAGSPGAPKEINTVTLATSIHPRDNVGNRWWLKGCVSRKLAEVIMHLIKDMASGKLSEAWENVTKGAIAENILNLTQLSETQRVPGVCLRTPTLWVALASLCVLDKDHVERLSSGQWSKEDGQSLPPRPTCSNHDDGETNAVIQCSVCGNLCADCDRFLHLHRKTRNHQRQVCKEEEEAIKVELHEGCGRTKLFWLLAVADARTLKALIEFRDGGTRTRGAGTSGVCRFCGATGSSGLLAIGNVCADQECQEYAKAACSKLLNCGHMCGGVLNEMVCLPCLHGCSSDSTLKQDADDMCMICFTEALSCAPALQLKCGHVFHLHCCKAVLMKRWAGPRITFSFSQCPICKSDIEHPLLLDLLNPIQELYKDVRRKALMRLEYEGLHNNEAVITPGTKYYNDPATYAMDRYAYYVCYKCNKAYYGGEARCDAEVGDNYDPTELVCGACSDVARAQMCPKHGTDFLEYKCRYCCSVAVFFCFGTTHFCNPCHDDFQRVTNLPKNELPSCPAGPKGRQLDGDECPLHVKHPPTGEEFALGCGVCRNAHTF